MLRSACGWRHGRARSSDARTLHSSGLDAHLNFASGKTRPPPVRPRCPETLGLGSSKKADVCACAAKMRCQARTLPEGLLLDRHFCHASVQSKRQILSAQQGFGDRQRFFVSYGVKCGFPGLLDRLNRAPKNARCSAKAGASCSSQVLLLSCRRIPGASILKSTCTDFAGVGWCRRLEWPCGCW